MLGKLVDIKLYFICCCIIGLFFTFNLNYYEFNASSHEVENTLVIKEVYENYSIVGDDERDYFIYNGDNEFRKGNKVLFNGQLVNIRGSYNDFYNYLNKKNIHYELNYHSFKIVDDHVSADVMIVDKLLKNKSNVSKSYLKLILFNQKDEFNKGFYNTFSIYSLTYLIAVSGFHINLLLMFFKKIFHNNIVGIGVVSFYLYLLNFSVSSYRAFLCYFFKNINKKLGFNLSSLDVVSLIGSVFLICNPCIMFSFGFIYSFLGTFILEIFKLYKNKKINIMFYVYLVNLPLLLLNYYKLNVSTLFFSVILNGPISFLYVFSFVFLFLDKFYLLYEITITLFYKLFSVLNRLNCVLVFGKPSIVFVIFYYLLLLYFFVFKEQKRKIRYIYALLLFFLAFYQYCKPLLNPYEYIYFLNVGQGDCSIFFIPHSKDVVLVDTGGSNYKDIATAEIIPFLESKGVNKISKVILTHDDFDHSGALESLKNNFYVGDVVDSSLVKDIRIGNKIFINLNISEKRDNDGSIVLYGEYAGYNLLLMGDASKEIESKIMDNNMINVDIIKIGHHGSNTSSGYEFLDNINGKIAIISVGKNNIYGHPHDDVVENLEALGYVIFRTDENNDIGFGKNIFNLRFVDYFN